MFVRMDTVYWAYIVRSIKEESKERRSNRSAADTRAVPVDKLQGLANTATTTPVLSQVT